VGVGINRQIDWNGLLKNDAAGYDAKKAFPKQQKTISDKQAMQQAHEIPSPSVI
jgi:hypothetical protein